VGVVLRTEAHVIRVNPPDEPILVTDLMVDSGVDHVDVLPGRFWEIDESGSSGLRHVAGEVKRRRVEAIHRDLVAREELTVQGIGDSAAYCGEVPLEFVSRRNVSIVEGSLPVPGTLVT